jgi:hypothetical protein
MTSWDDRRLDVAARLKTMEFTAFATRPKSFK